uniref:FRIGIDA-like protein n=1 Tax=Zea mays TaxID=4577 RepID=A0A804Q731_MAIZE
MSHARNVKTSPGAQNEMNERELSALKSVIKCIEEHKLEQQYPVDPLQKRVLQLEKAKADKRMAVEAAKPQSKRPRANGSAFATRATGFADKSFYSATPERHPFNPCERQRLTRCNLPMDLITVMATQFSTRSRISTNGDSQVQVLFPNNLA